MIHRAEEWFVIGSGAHRSTPEHCREALELLAEHATDAWLERHGTSDEARRAIFRPEVVMNIEAQLARARFSPKLGGLDGLRNITGTQPGSPSASE
ncbi:MAG TPA: hypothetical protein VG388_13095 [Solirubrobacteraceae bacterium]|nr:hypothetical protein [Solirubrobacteraceae bacterium]